MENKTVSQAARFTVVGILNSIIDISIVNLLPWLGFTLAFTLFGQRFLVANIIAVTVAMINSFLLNHFWAFRSAKEKTNFVSEVAKFLVITVIGIYVINQIVFNAIYFNMPALTDWVYSIVAYLNLDNFFSAGFVKTTFAKVVAIGVSLVWNFIGYKFFVFKK